MTSVALRRIRPVVVALLVALLAFAGTAVAGAHATLVGTDPTDGSSVAAGPQRVSATFNEPMQPTFAAMTVVGPDGDMWADGEPVVEDRVISVAVRPLGPAGTYTVNYRATSADGHVVSGSWSFELTEAGPGEPAPAPADAPDAPGNTDSGDSATLVWPFAVGAILVVIGAVVWAVRRRT